MLTETEAAVLAFERNWWQRPGSKEQAILAELAMSTTRYYQALNYLIDRPDALARDPLVVRRLQRLRARRQARRAG